MKPRSKCAGTVPASFEIGLGVFGVRVAQKITPLEKRADRHFGPFFQRSLQQKRSETPLLGAQRPH